MKATVEKILHDRKRTIPILSFPSTQLLGITVPELISSAENQALGMKAIADRCSIAASLNMMDLSVEAQAFGAQIAVSDHEIPTVIGRLLESAQDIQALQIPAVGEGRTGIYIDGVARAKKLIADVPVFCGVIGPYSLAGRLFDMTELMMACYDEPEAVHSLLSKCTAFIIEYIKAFKAVGADGVVMAEPAAGLLSPGLCEEFSSPYCKQIRDAVNDESFVFVYHNCGNTIPLAESLVSIDADIYHFGNAIDLSKIIPLFPGDKVILGNINPVDFRTASPEKIYESTRTVMESCAGFANFRVSTGCDIPADARWENIDAFFAAARA